MESRRVFDGGFVLVDSVKTDRPRASEVASTRAGDTCVAVLVYGKKTHMVYFVRQDRAAMITEQNPDGTIVEVVAGRCDVLGERLKLVVKCELLEKMGTEVTEEQIELLNSGKFLALSPGIVRERMILAFVELDDGSEVKLGKEYGLHGEGERTKVVGLGLDLLEDYKAEDMKTFALIQWFLRRQTLKG